MPRSRANSAAPARSSRRGRPPTIDSQRLLAVARDVFLERGIRATTLEVAERAGVSEGVLFHRFKSKEALFSAAMDFDREEPPRRVLKAIEELRREELEAREAIIRLATTLVEVGRVALPIMMMSWSNPQPLAAPLFDEKRKKFQQILKSLGSYFELQMERGKLRQLDAEVLARTLLGSVHHFVLTRILIEEGDGAAMPEGMFVRGLADLLLNGAAASDTSPPRNARFAARP
ncbi:MAG TPA: helix-turn-helix domain-containing protein [Polyangiaceae bacterium]|nr:helix-turn-helix domain-containing protein [Polyangiaceae bacterium]